MKKDTLIFTGRLFSDDMVNDAIGKTVVQLQKQHGFTPEKAAILHKRAAEVEAWNEGIGVQ